MTIFARRWGPPLTQSSVRRNSQNGRAVGSTSRQNSPSEANHSTVNAWGLPIAASIISANSITTRVRAAFSGQAGRMLRLLIGGAFLITAAALPASKTNAQQLFFPWVPSSTTQTSGTVTTGNTFQTILTANTSRKGCVVQNQSTHVMYVFLGALASATTAKSYQLTALGGARDTFYCNQGPIVMTDNVNVMTSTTSDAFVVLSF